MTDFGQWLAQNHTPKYASELLRYVRKYYHVLEFPERAAEISVLSMDTRRLVMSGLANLSKYLGCYEHWKAIVKNSGLKWEKKVSLDIVLDIMNTDLGDTWVWLKEVVQKVPREYGTVLVFAALSGLRPTEAVNSTRLISELSESGRLDTYLNKDMMMLEHFRFKDLFLRRCKNAFISFITPELLELVLKYKPDVRYAALDTIINRLRLPNKTKYLRKYYATVLREYLPTEAIDLLQGRINQSVFLRYYYKPFLQDIKAKALRGIEPLQSELLTLFP